jgi:cbb3-type cytochrome oxidase cytochrome c subunit
VLYVGEKTFWSEQPRWGTYPVSGAFHLRHPYDYATSGGPDVIVTIGKSPGDIALEAIALVAPSDPANPVRVP